MTCTGDDLKKEEKDSKIQIPLPYLHTIELCLTAAVWRGIRAQGGGEQQTE